MVEIAISKGLDIPISGKPTGKIQLSYETTTQKKPEFIALNLDPFEDTRFKLLAKTDDTVKIGQPLVEDKSTKGRVFVSPAGGVVAEIRRGLKRRLLDIVIKVNDNEDYEELSRLDLNHATESDIIDKLLEGGLFANIRARPFNLLADPKKKPRSIFVKAIESAPFMPPAELQVQGNEEDFQTGLKALSKLTSGRVHLVHHRDSTFPAFVNAKNVTIHTATGPHPVSSISLHIQRIDPIKRAEDVIWTVNAHDVVTIGHLLNTGRYFIDRVISIAGPGIIEGRTGYFKVRAGYPIEALISDRIKKGFVRLISGEPLTGQKVEQEDFLGFYDFVFCAIPENTERKFLHFFRLGLDKYSFSKAYVSGHLNPENRSYAMTTSQHGEKRAFIDPTLYDKVMPLRIPTMQLVKAVMAEDYDLAEELGLLEVDEKDFALPTFVCPSKMDMTEIMKQGLLAYAAEVLE